ncbi:L-arabinose 1-dehydrogenase (NAD(P)(+)) [uncultured archaeon]|nr:L-arabinose 1-dehydrogenase (NAD(P)(+)) [uncultured archaeon]
MKILVTGGAGFIGSHLVDALLSKGHQVEVLDSFASSSPANVPRGVKVHKADIRKRLDPSAFEGCGAVFHLAADPNVKTSAENARENFDINATGTFNVLDACREAGAGRFVFTSTSTVYGKAEIMPTPESHPTIPASNYGASKLAGEAYCSSFAATYGIKATVLRFANIFGERSTHGVMFDFYQKLKKDPQRMEILGNGKQNKSYLHVSDCVSAMLLCFEKQPGSFGIYNVGSEEQRTVDRIASLVASELGVRPGFTYTGGEGGWKGDVSAMLLDVKKMKSLGWKPAVGFEHGVSRYVKWLKENF